MALNPSFNIPFPKEQLVSVIEKLQEEQKAKKQSELLKKLLCQFKPINFRSRSYPEYDRVQQEYEKAKSTQEKESLSQRLEKFKLRDKHYYIGCIDEIQRLSIENDWDIALYHEDIYLYNGEYWQKVELSNFQLFLSDVAKVLEVPQIIESHYIFRINLYKQFAATQILPTPEIKSDEVYVNLLDCTLKITNGKVAKMPFNKELFLTYQLPYDYNEEATCEKFYKFLNEVLPDESAQKVLSEYLGYLFIRHGNKSIKAEKMLILYGTGANGKSVVFEIIKELFGKENSTNHSITSLTDSQGYSRAQLSGKLVNYGSEIGGKHEGDMLKKMISGEEIEARHPYGRPFILHTYAKLLFNCNQLPKDVEQTDAYFRRFLILPFNVTIEEDKQDKLLASKIIEDELPGILNWVLDGLKRLLAQGRFTKCKASDEILTRYKVESDSVQMFMEELNIIKSSNEKEFHPLKDVYKAYREYCTENGYKPLSKINFSKRLEVLKFFIVRKNIGLVVFLSKPLEIVF